MRKYLCIFVLVFATTGSVWASMAGTGMADAFSGRTTLPCPKISGLAGVNIYNGIKVCAEYNNICKNNGVNGVCTLQCSSSKWNYFGKCCKRNGNNYVTTDIVKKQESSECGTGVKTCDLKCDNGTWVLNKVVECKSGYNKTNGKCVKQSGGASKKKKSVSVPTNVSGLCGNEVEASNSDTGNRGAYIVHKYAVKGWKDGYNDFNCTIKGKHLSVYQEDGIWYTDRKCVDTSSRPGCTQAYPKGQAPAPVETPVTLAQEQKPEVTALGNCGNEVEASNSDTGNRGAYIVHKYAVKGWKDGYNDFKCTIKGKHLSVYQEDGIWYTDRKCVDTSSRPGCTQAYPKGQAPAPVETSVASSQESKSEVEESAVNQEEEALLDDAETVYVCDLVEISKLDVWEKSCKNTNQEIMALIAQIREYCSGKPEAGEFERLMAAIVAMEPEKCAVIMGERAGKAQLAVSDAVARLDSIVSTLEVSKWKDTEGKFNTARLASDSIAGVVLGTAGGLITSNVVKKHQVEDGFEDLQCVIGGQTVAGWGDEFLVGVQ